MLPRCANVRYIGASCKVRVGEVIEVTSLQGSFSLVSGILSVVVLGLFALLTNGPGDDDDSNGSGGGGLMQPIA